MTILPTEKKKTSKSKKKEFSSKQIKLTVKKVKRMKTITMLFLLTLFLLIYLPEFLPRYIKALDNFFYIYIVIMASYMFLFLLKCPNCNARIKNNSKRCLKCSIPFIYPENKKGDSNQRFKNILLISVVVILVGPMIFLIDFFKPVSGKLLKKYQRYMQSTERVYVNAREQGEEQRLKGYT